QLRQQTDRALLVVVGCNLFEWGTFLRRLDNFLRDLVLNQRDVERLLDALMERHLATLDKVCRAVGDVVDILRFGDDLGTDTGPFMRPETYRRLFKPRHTLLCDYVHQHSQMHTFLHSCGSIYKLIPDLIEAGFEILNPVQTNSRDMQAARLKQEFGKDVTFWGAGADTRSILNRATPQEVRAHVRRNIEILSPGGGFVFNPIHNLMPDVPPENIMAMFAAVDEFR
ncbi:MAG TPA: methyltransferase, partial [Chloroflexi bacterium]|nr:methyltransferase [Chloroflexota bacterium]